MPDPEKATQTEEPASEFEKFAQEYHDAKFQRTPPEEPATGDEKVTLESKPEKTEPDTKPAPAEEGAKGATVEETPKQTPPDSVEEPQVKLYTVPDHEMYGALRGQKVTAAQLEEAGLISKVITRDHQEMHNTKLYQELKREFEEKLADAMKQGVKTAPAQSDKPQISPKDFADQLERTYVPVLKQLAEAGSFEPDFVEAYPKFAAHAAHQFETMRLVGAGLVQAMQEIRGWVGTKQTRETSESSKAYLDRAMTELAGTEDLYKGLGDPSEREAFVAWMADKDNKQPWKKLDIVKELAEPETLKGAYAAYRTATRHLRTERPPATPDTSRDRKVLAAPGGGNARPATKTDPGDEFSQLKNEFLESKARAFGR